MYFFPPPQSTALSSPFWAYCAVFFPFFFSFSQKSPFLSFLSARASPKPQPRTFFPCLNLACSSQDVVGPVAPPHWIFLFFHQIVSFRLLFGGSLPSLDPHPLPPNPVFTIPRTLRLGLQMPFLNSVFHIRNSPFLLRGRSLSFFLPTWIMDLWCLRVPIPGDLRLGELPLGIGNSSPSQPCFNCRLDPLHPSRETIAWRPPGHRNRFSP